MKLTVKTLPHLDDSEELSQRLHLANHLKYLFNFAYYIGFSPVRFVWNKEGDRKFTILSWRPQQIFCASMHILCIFLLVANIRDSIPSNKSSVLKHATLYFDLALDFCRMFYKVVTMKRFWVNSSEYLQIFQAILNEEFLHVRTSWICSPRFLYLFYGFTSLKLLTYLVGGYKFVVPVSKWTPSWWFRRLIARGTYVFSFSSQLKSSEAPDWPNITVGDGLLAVVTGFAQFSEYCASEICDLTILSVAITLWVASNSFASYIEKSQNENNAEDCTKNIVVLLETTKKVPSNHGLERIWSRIYSQFQALGNLSSVINVALGTLVTWYLAEGLMYYSIHLNTLFISKDMLKKFYCSMSFLITIFIFSISADIRNQVESAKSWLMKKQNIKSVPMDEAYLVLNEVINKDIGVRGHNTFTITYSFVAAYLSLIVTFFIICVQESDLKME